jgi:hypothetical protein
MHRMDALTATAPRCMDCGADLTDAPHRPAYTNKNTDPLIKCVPCETAAWARVDAHAATLGPSTAANNVWD